MSVLSRVRPPPDGRSPGDSHEIAEKLKLYKPVARLTPLARVDAVATTVTGAEAVEWNLDDLYVGPDDPRLPADLESGLAAAKAFRERYRGKVAGSTLPR